LGGVTGTSQPDPAAGEDQAAISSPTTSTPADNQGEVILQGRYRLESELGRGGFGAVYKAWDINVSRPCAVKENLDTTVEAARQFGREASVLANLSHPNLPRVTDHFSIPGKGQYLVMDFVDGEDLASILERQAIVPYQQAVEWISQVAEALEYLHDQEPPVLHRDIKPANIRITRKSRAILVDFGLVKLYDPKLQTTLGARAVTPGYAPPEQYGKGKTDARTDIYALGATLYHLTTGVEPLESVQRVSGERMQNPHEINPQIPLSLSQAIERSLALDPAGRYQNMAEFRSAIIASLSPKAETIQPEFSEASQYLSSPDDVTVVDHSPINKPVPAQPQPMAPQSIGPARPASQPQARPAPQRPASQPPARPASRPAPRPASQPRPATRKRWLPVSIILIVVVLCMVAALVGSGLLLNRGPTSTQITATVQAQRTLSAGLQATSTAIFERQATTTAAVKPSP
jgi:serine/threonine-protein kinase